MTAHIELISERLILRPINIIDANLIYAYRSNAIVNRYQGWIPKTMEDVHDFINNRVSPDFNVTGTWFQFVIIKKDNRELIGDIGVHFFDPDGCDVELGCTLNQLQQGHGYASESLIEIIKYLFSELKKNRITASIDPRNEKSIQLFERLGFRKEAHFKKSYFINNEWVDDLLYSIVKNDWEIENRLL